MVLALTLALGSSAVAAEPEDGLQDLAWATGYGNAYGPADLAYAEVGIGYQGARLAGAMRDNDAAVARVRRVLLGRGVAARDIFGSGLEMSRFYRSAHGELRPRYQADRTLAVVLRDVDHAQQILGAAVAAGGSGVGEGDLTWGVSQRHLESLTKSARALAFAEARARAATEAGRPLGAVHVIAEELNRPYETRELQLGAPLSGGGKRFARSAEPADAERRRPEVGIQIQSTAAWNLGPGPDTPRTVSVVGLGAASGPARDVVVRFTVERTLTPAAAARREVAAGMRRIRESLAAHGIPARDLRLTYSGVLPSQKSFQARQVLEVTLRNVGTAERTIVAAATAGGSDADVGSVGYTVTDRRELTRIATDAATDQARQITEQYAALARLRLGKDERWGRIEQSDRPYEGASEVAAGPRPIRPGPNSMVVGAREVEVQAPMTRSLG